MATDQAATTKKYIRRDEIARGKFGVVYQCECLATKERLAMKLMPKRANKPEDVNREVAILKKLNHPGILGMTDFMESGDAFVLVTELLIGPEFFDYLSENDYLEEREARFYMKQLLEAIAYFHQNKIVHLDLKPENIVMKDQGGGQLKIIDFGTAQDLSVTPTPKVLTGTPEFVAPEVLNFDPVSPAADMWAVGVIAYIVLTGLSPFLGNTKSETIMSISKGKFEYPEPCPEEGYDDISSNAKSFINRLLKVKPKERDDAQKSLTHTWLDTRDSKRYSTSRLKTFKARRKWGVITTVARVSVSFSRMSRGSTGSGSYTGTVSPISPGPDDAIAP